MTGRKPRVNALDIALILAVVLLFASGYLRKLNTTSLEEKLTVKNVTVTLQAKGIAKEDLSLFSVGDTVYSSDRNELGKIGSVESIRSAPAIVVAQNEDSFYTEPDFENVDLTIRVTSSCSFDQNGMCYLGGKRIAPAQTFSANNGRILFSCEITEINAVS